MANIDRMVVNAAIERLIALDPDWERNAAIVIEAAKDYPTAAPFRVSGSFSHTSSNMFKGFAPGAGNVELKEEEEKHHEFEWGIKRERIGSYRVWKESPGNIAFQHFWKSSIVTASLTEQSLVYYVFYDKKTLFPRSLKVREEICFFDFLGIKLMRPELVLLQGRD